MSDWSQACCERCWIDQHASFDADGNVITVREPVRTIRPRIERCAWCGRATIVGIMVRVDPKTVRFPTLSPHDA